MEAVKQPIALKIGTRLAFPVNYGTEPILIVTDIREEGGRVILVLADERQSDRTYEVNSTRPHTIGRRDGKIKQDIVLDEQKNPSKDGYAISRRQGVFAWDASKKAFFYTDYGQNPAKSEEFEEGVEKDSPDQTITDKETGEGEYFGLELKPGMYLCFGPDVPKIHVHLDGNKLVLRPEEMKKVKKSSLEVDRESTGKTIGAVIKVAAKKSEEADLAIDTFGISRIQGWVAYDKQDRTYIYSNVGKYPVSWGFSKEVFREVEEQPVPQRLQDAVVALKKVIDLYDQVCSEVVIVEDVQYKEMATFITPADKLGGGKTEYSQKGYQIWLNAYKEIYDARLSDEDRGKIDYFSTVLDQLALDRAALRKIEEATDPMVPYKSKHAELPYHTEMDKIVQEKIAILKEKGEVYLISGFHGHHAVCRIKLPPGTMTTYNAGAEARETGKENLVMGVYEQEIKDPAAIPDLIRTVFEKKMREVGYRDVQNYKEVLNDIDGKLNPDIIRHVDMPPQHKGNCTTRSTREALADFLGRDSTLFAHLHEHISDPERVNVEDLKVLLQARVRALEKQIDFKIGTRAADQIIAKIRAGDYRFSEDKGQVHEKADEPPPRKSGDEEAFSRKPSGSVR